MIAVRCERGCYRISGNSRRTECALARRRLHAASALMSAARGNADSFCSARAFPSLTQSRRPRIRYSSRIRFGGLLPGLHSWCAAASLSSREVKWNHWRGPMMRTTLAVLFGAWSLAGLPAPAQAAITEQEAHAIAVDAYLYLYPLVIMDITRKQSTNIEPGKEFGKGPMNEFTNVKEYPPADFKGVVRVNFDTLYSIAWLDLTKEPMIVSAPNTDGRYYLLPMLDMWTDVFASPGWRTTG